MRKILYWLPRILAVLFILFISLFALDVLGEPRWLLALIIHLIPNYILIALTVVAWKYEKVGGILFLIGGLLMSIFYHSLVIAIPSFLIGVFFLISGFKRLKIDK